jgi:hypothetical protein
MEKKQIVETELAIVTMSEGKKKKFLCAFYDPLFLKNGS